MARIYSIGFETNSVTNGVEANSIQWNTNAGAMSIQTGTVRTGTYALKDIASGSGEWFAVTGSTGHSQYMRMYFQVGVNTGSTVDIISMIDSAFAVTIGQISINTSGQLLLQYTNTSGVFTQIGSNSSSLGTGSFHMIELHIDDTGGSASTVVEGRLDGVVFATGTVSIKTNSGLPSGHLGFGNLNLTPSATGTFFWDDIAINDSTGANQTGYPGIGAITRITPNAAGDANTFATQTGGTAGSANNFTRVDEVTPDNATSFNGSTVLGQQDLFKCTDPAIGTDTVSCVQVLAIFRNNTVDITTAFVIQCEKTAGGTLASGAAIDPDGTTWITSSPANSLVLYNDPDGAAWVEATLATMQIGYKISTAHTNAIDITTIWAYVDHAPTVVASKNNSFITLLGVGNI